MYVITNMTDKNLKIEGVTIEPKRQLSVSHITPDMKVEQDKGTLRVLSGDETLAERRANIEAVEAFKPE